MIIALHGFLGKPSDWDGFNLSIPLIAPEINNFSKPEPDSILMGYSLGGRLALQALIKAPHLWKAAIIISAHPGIENLEERKQRLFIDEVWAQRFLHDPWDKVLADWNSQPIYHKGKPLQRHEKDYDRQQLADMLRNFSLGHQDYLTPLIAELPMPILWMTGEYDQRFRDIGRTIRLKNPRSAKYVVPESGHRIPWDNKDAFEQIVNKFLIELKE